ncbi:MAG TPA: RsmB/NOP family class I SAM-dependent RNA methyltransferase [Kofleriaceae bacterium]|nr:RsmB/NOP family class I SAM-dependent RNA methyltransferase [Kofleriaceae bacterium]
MTDHQLAAQVAEGGRLRSTLLELWQRTRMDWGFVTDRLAVTFRNEKWIGAHERRFISETLYGLVRHLRRIDLALERARRTKKSPRDLERLLALLVLDKLIEPAIAAQVEPDLDWRAVPGVDEAIAAERNVEKRIALAASLPDWLAKQFVADWGAEAEPLALALNQRAPMTVRANTLATSRDALAAELKKENLETHAGKWSDTALVVDSRTNLFASAAFKRGAMEAQDEGSQLLASLATESGGQLGSMTRGLATPGKLIVDYCAGAGGKTLAIAARLANRGRIIATDIDDKKLEELRKRARRAGVSNVQAVPLENGAWPRELDSVRGKADIVFVDAPCSGTGALRRNPEARWRMREQDIEGFQQKQLAIMKQAIELAAPGARIVYATCSLLTAENEDVSRQLAGVELADLRSVLAERAEALSREAAFTVTPHRHGTDGFYARIMTRAR